MITSRELLDTSIAQLWTLARFLGEQLGEDRDGIESDTAETRACHEIVRSLRELILSLEAAGDVRGGDTELPATRRRWHESYPHGHRPKSKRGELCSLVDKGAASRPW
jgi:hypothetical protein